MIKIGHKLSGSYWELGKPVNEYLAIQEPKSGRGSDNLDAIRTCVSQTTAMEDGKWKEKLTAFGAMVVM